MAIHVRIQGTFRPITDDFKNLNASQFEIVSTALRNEQMLRITPALEDMWKDLQTEDGSIVDALDSAYEVVRNGLMPPPGEDLVVTPAGSDTEWLDLGELGHEFTKELLLQSTQPGSTPQPWVISDDVPSIGTFEAHLFITGKITTDEAGPPS